jgi:hypothetical protein
VTNKFQSKKGKGSFTEYPSAQRCIESFAMKDMVYQTNFSSEGSDPLEKASGMSRA